MQTFSVFVLGTAKVAENKVAMTLNIKNTYLINNLFISNLFSID